MVWTAGTEVWTAGTNVWPVGTSVWPVGTKVLLVVGGLPTTNQQGNGQRGKEADVSHADNRTRAFVITQAGAAGLCVC